MRYVQVINRSRPVQGFKVQKFKDRLGGELPRFWNSGNVEMFSESCGRLAAEAPRKAVRQWDSAQQSYQSWILMRKVNRTRAVDRSEEHTSELQSPTNLV